MTFYKLCKYKHILGNPNEGIHYHRVPGTSTAMVDYVMSIIGAWVISTMSDIPLPLITVIIIVTGEILHWIFCIPTTTLKYLKLNLNL